jgi:hypothetical protein
MIKVGPDGTVLSTTNRNFAKAVFFPQALISTLFPSDRCGWKQIAHQSLRRAGSCEPLFSRDCPPKQRVFRGIVHQLLPEAAVSNGRAGDRNSGNQIARLLADPFGLIHQFSISSFQRSSAPSFIGSIRD